MRRNPAGENRQDVKEKKSVPVIASNRINDPALGEEIIRQGQADLVTMARALLADPELPNKAKEGRVGEIRHCIACNQGCFDNIFRLSPACCLVNPHAGMEAELDAAPSPHRKKVLVVGGGPAGMKAACTAAERGHWITLVERTDRLGGQILLNRHIPGRDMGNSTRWTVMSELRRLGVKIITGATVTGIGEEAVEIQKYESHELLPADTVIIATGSKPVCLPVGQLNESVSEIYTIGDAKQPRNALEAIREGFLTGLKI